MDAWRLELRRVCASLAPCGRAASGGREDSLLLRARGRLGAVYTFVQRVYTGQYLDSSRVAFAARERERERERVSRGVSRVSNSLRFGHVSSVCASGDRHEKTARLRSSSLERRATRPDAVSRPAPSLETGNSSFAPLVHVWRDERRLSLARARARARCLRLGRSCASAAAFPYTVLAARLGDASASLDEDSFPAWSERLEDAPLARACACQAATRRAEG